MNVELWKQRKKELGITFDELAELTNISRRQLLYLFKGKAKNPGIETVQRIEAALGITDEVEKEKAPAPELTDGERELFELISQLTEQEIDELSNFVDFILSKRK